ncbi:MAG: hypothetical protein IT553_05905 [Sphingomonadaceae bacterium]|nr:hypothetical protein [Sphingomonadaceae bacterium]
MGDRGAPAHADGRLFLRLAAMAAAFILGACVITTAAIPMVLGRDIPLLTTRSDVALATFRLRAAAARTMRDNVADAAGRSAGAPATSAAMRRLAVRLLATDPLSVDALTLAAADLSSAQRRASERPLITEAHRRNPRDRGPIAWSIIDNVLERRFADAAHGFERMVIVSPNDAESIVPLMTLIANDSAARGILLQTLAKPQSWHARLAGQLEQSQLPLPILRQFAAAMIRNPDPPVRQSILSMLINRNDFAEAHRLWALQQGGNSAHALVNDPRFMNSPDGAFPFGWTYSDNVTDRAVQLDGGGLEVHFSGQASVTFVTQMLVLRPGTYRLRLTGDDSLRSEALQWRLTCRASGAAPLANLDLGNVSTGASTAQIVFSVPASGCGAQTLALVGAPLTFPEDRVVTMRQIAVLPAVSAELAQ